MIVFDNYTHKSIKPRKIVRLQLNERNSKKGRQNELILKTKADLKEGCDQI